MGYKRKKKNREGNEWEWIKMEVRNRMELIEEHDEIELSEKEGKEGTARARERRSRRGSWKKKNNIGT